MDDSFATFQNVYSFATNQEREHVFETADALLNAMKSQVPQMVSKTSESILTTFLPLNTKIARHFARTFPSVLESVTTSALLTVAHSRYVPYEPIAQDGFIALAQQAKAHDVAAIEDAEVAKSADVEKIVEADAAVEADTVVEADSATVADTGGAMNDARDAGVTKTRGRPKKVPKADTKKSKNAAMNETNIEAILEDLEEEKPVRF